MNSILIPEFLIEGWWWWDFDNGEGYGSSLDMKRNLFWLRMIEQRMEQKSED